MVILIKTSVWFLRDGVKKRTFNESFYVFKFLQPILIFIFRDCSVLAELLEQFAFAFLIVSKCFNHSYLDCQVICSVFPEF